MESNGGRWLNISLTSLHWLRGVLVSFIPNVLLCAVVVVVVVVVVGVEEVVVVVASAAADNAKLFMLAVLSRGNEDKNAAAFVAFVVSFKFLKSFIDLLSFCSRSF